MKYYLIIFIFLLTACKKERTHLNVSCEKPTNDIGISTDLIVGKWIWVSEYYVQPFTGNVFFKSPQTEGYSRQLIANNSTFEYFKNSTLQQKYYYEFVVERLITNYYEDSTNVLVFKDYITGQRTNYVHYKICNDTLILNFQIRSDLAGQEKWAKSK